MSKPRSPWMKFYGDDFTGGTRHFTCGQVGAYIRLLWASWENEDGTLPGDDASLARIAGIDLRNWRKTIRTRILTKFKRLPDGRIYNQRLVDERAAVNRAVVQLSLVKGPQPPDDGACLRETVSGSMSPKSKSPNENSHAAVQQRALRALARDTDTERAVGGGVSTPPPTPPLPPAARRGAFPYGSAAALPAGETAKKLEIIRSVLGPDWQPGIPDGQDLTPERNTAIEQELPGDEDIPEHLQTPFIMGLNGKEPGRGQPQ